MPPARHTLLLRWVDLHGPGAFVCPSSYALLCVHSCVCYMVNQLHAVGVSQCITNTPDSTEHHLRQRLTCTALQSSAQLHVQGQCSLEQQPARVWRVYWFWPRQAAADLPAATSPAAGQPCRAAALPPAPHLTLTLPCVSLLLLQHYCCLRVGHDKAGSPMKCSLGSLARSAQCVSGRLVG